jgi:hypothetical protein
LIIFIFSSESNRSQHSSFDQSSSRTSTHPADELTLGRSWLYCRLTFKVAFLAIRGSRVADLLLGGQLRVALKGKERVYLDKQWFDQGTIRWVAFYSDCEHEVLPVTAGHRITLTYQLYVSECIGGHVQPQLQMPDSKSYPIYRCIKDMLASPTFMKNGGILGFRRAYQYPETFEGTYFYERYPLTLKGIDAVIYAVFRALELTVHIKPYEVGRIIGGEIADAKMRFQSLSTKEATGGGPVANEVRTTQSLDYGLQGDL